ncbi:MAG: hypothetical protein ACYTG2_00010 [Planctomycetota bacterium]|jgi:hypothetical protein
MTRPIRSRVRRVTLASLLVATLLTVPVAAWFVRPTVYFSASFDLSGSPGNPLPLADVGLFSQATPADGFVVEGGKLTVSDQGSPTEAVLTGEFKKQFVGQELRLEFELRPSQSTTALSVRMVDDSDTGMIDVTFGGDGWIRVGGQPVTPYDPGSTYDVAVDLNDPLAGVEYWVATITSDGSVWQDSGPLQLSKQMTVRSVEVVRPAGSTAGEFRLDDLQALSYKILFGL